MPCFNFYSLLYFYQASALAKKHELKFHLDGARIFNAAIALGVPVCEIAAPFDSVYFFNPIFLNHYAY